MAYLIAVVATAAALGLRIALNDWLGHEAPLLLFILAILLAAWYGGLKPGLLATGLSLLAGTYFFVERTGLHIHHSVDLLRMSVLVLLGGLTSGLCESVHRSRGLMLAQQQALQASNDRLFTFISTAPVALAMFDREMRYLAVSQRWLTDFGLDSRDLIEKSPDGDFPNLAERWRAILPRGLAGERIRAEEDSFIRPDGKPQWVRWELLPWFTGDGAVGGIIISAEDFTQRKLAEEALRTTESRQRSLIDALSELVWRTDPAGEPLDLSREWTELTGQPVDQSVNQGWLEAVHPLDREPTRERWQAALASQQPYEAEFRARRPDGTWRHMLARGLPVRDQSGRVVEWVGVLLDVSKLKEIEQALRESEERYRVLTEAQPNMVWTSSREGLPEFVNHQWVAFTGRTLEQLNSQSWQDLIHPDDQESTLGVIARALTRDQPYELELRLRRQDGAFRRVLVRAVPLKDAGGAVLKWIGSIMDIHDRWLAEQDRRKAEEALQTSERRLRAILQAEPECVKLVSEDGTLLAMNPAGLAMVEADCETQVVGLSVCPLIHEEYRDAFLDLNRRVFAGESGKLEFEIVGLKGSRRFMETHATPLRDPQGRILAQLAVTRDITERKKLQEKLLASQRMLETVLNNIPQGVFWKDRQSRYLGCNTVVSRAFGLGSPENLIGMTDRMMPALKKEQADYFIQKDQEILESGQPILGIIEQATLADGSTVWMETNKIPLRDERGEVVGVLGTWQDITERRKLEEQLRQSQKMEAVGQLAGGVAHDFNNLLTVITGYSDVLLDSMSPTDPHRHDVEQIRDAGERAASLTSQLLAFSRKQLLQPRILDLNAVVADSRNLLRRVIGEDISLSVLCEESPALVKADPGQLGQVLLNLAVNARDAMPRGGQLTIETRNVELDESVVSVRPGKYVLLAVSDSGCGMTPNVQARIFEPFFTTKEVGKGTGLGLAVVHGIIKQSEGHIEVYSEPGHGTTFKVYLPCVEEAPGACGVAEQRALRRGKETVLLVEDEEGVRNLSQLALKNHGYTVLTAMDGQEALRIATNQRGPIHLLVTDVVMPGISGPELAQVLQDRDPLLKVLFVSGYTQDAVLRHGILDGDAAYLQKPFGPVALASKVREVLDSNNG